MLERAMDGQGCVVGAVRSPGIGNSRLVCELATMAKRSGADVFSTYCEAHRDVPFHVVADLLRAAFGVLAFDDDSRRLPCGTALGLDTDRAWTAAGAVECCMV
jgi:adenylate cyclase